ncbi:hypothetical protein I6A60_27460 [Frankia sp. AgB1.9]|uniref:hypothetical protein n=1 Tax=unclassified Frankia TaxID=2632575 RepID=UPI001933178D|nr:MULTISPECIES: hypothetical protein [unclassified Frankia]MBL7489177.1 hypothetical protein [Frankia sp. AgW1.1]MBL7551567.1 hypothetical protein [Frankia sp. AgB1.9]MBL7621786.1 hypothetical protein [Frankia sp. AgB1.8]
MSGGPDPGARFTSAARDLDGEPWERDEFARVLSWRLERPISAQAVLLTEAETMVASRLLEELAGVYPDEPLGQLARYLAMTFSTKAWAGED